MDIASLISGLSYAQTLAGLLVDERDSQKAAAIKGDLMEKITGTQAKLAEVLAVVLDQQATIQNLTERNRALEAAQKERERYALAQIGAFGALAYQLRPNGELEDRKDEPPHFICQVCFNTGQKSILQPAPNGKWLFCKVKSDHNLRLGDDPPIRTFPIANRWDGY